MGRRKLGEHIDILKFMISLFPGAKYDMNTSIPNCKLKCYIIFLNIMKKFYIWTILLKKYIKTQFFQTISHNNLAVYKINLMIFLFMHPAGMPAQ